VKTVVGSKGIEKLKSDAVKIKDGVNTREEQTVGVKQRTRSGFGHDAVFRWHKS
jgi:hypothetical protein